MKEKVKKAVFIVNSLGSGGAERVVVNLSNRMAELNYEVTIILLFNYINYELNNNITIYSLNEAKNASKIKKILYGIKSLIKLNRYVKKNNLLNEDTIITSHLPFANLICRLSLINFKTMYVIHGVYSMYEKKSKVFLSKILKFLYNNKKVVSVSCGVQNEMRERYKVNSNTMESISNPIDLNKINRLKNEELYYSEKYILFCGRLTEVKRPELILDIFKNEKLYKNYNLVFIGDGELKEKMIEKSKSLTIENKVSFEGWQENVYKWMKNAELLVSTSRFEAFPMNLIEALACGCKVVSFDCDYGPREILKEEYKNYLVENNNMDLLGKKIKEALIEYPSSMEEKVKELHIDNVINKYIKTYLSWNY